MIAVGAYFGLRARSVPATVPLPVPVADTSELYARVAADAQRALEATRATMTAACLHGITKPLHFQFRMGFSARGRETIRGISLQGDGPSEVATCLSDRFPPALTVPAPGVKVDVVASVDLP
jgi:hypothetical protein